MKQMLINCLAVGLAGFLGAIARYLLGLLLQTGAFPTATLLINVSGAFVLGYFMAVIGESLPLTSPLRLAVAVGFLGAFTTFSTMALEFDQLARQGLPLRAVAYIGLSMTLGLLAAHVGYGLGK